MPTREVTLKWDGMLRLRNNGTNITARVTNSPGVTGTWDEFSGHRNVSTKTTRVLGKLEWVGHSKLTRYEIHIQLSWDFKTCQSIPEVGRRFRRWGAGLWFPASQSWSNWSLYIFLHWLWNPLPLSPIKISSPCRGMSEVFGVMEMPCIMTVVVVTQRSPFVKTQQNLKLVNFIVYKLYFNRAGKKKEF